tara:strand:- start:2424 stop:3062 length:639 start_codon:yes stop_codon:yes gene_type:complete
MADKKAATKHALPEGRLINHALYVKDQYNEQSKPRYTVEIAYPKGVLNDFYNTCLDFAVETWGKGADADDSGLIVPIHDGEVMAKKREKKGKPGDAYNGMEVIRASTAFNLHGEDGPGGVQVFDHDVNLIDPVNSASVYQGCMGIVGVTLGAYQDEKTGNNAITLYLTAFQKTGDGERLVAVSDHSSLFKVVGGTDSEDAETAPVERAKRKG